MSAAAVAPPTGPNGSARSTSRSRSMTSWAPDLAVRGYFHAKASGGVRWNDWPSSPFLPGFYQGPEPDLDLCPSIVRKGPGIVGVEVCPIRVRCTMIRRQVHNIYSSCHVTVTYIMDNGPQS